MLMIHGEIRDDLQMEEALSEVRRQIPQTLAAKPLAVEEVVAAADRLARDVIEERLALTAPGYDVTQIAQMFLAENLTKRYELELSHLPRENGRGGRFLRQPLGVLLHIAAGNMDVLPAYSVLEGLLAGNINLLKLPSLDGGLSLVLLKRLTEYEKKLANYIYVFDTPSTDIEELGRLMELAHGIAVWGSDAAVRAVRAGAPANVRLIEWGHKLSFAYLRERIVPEEKLRQLARHILLTRQLLCSSCQVIFLNTADFEEVKAFGQHFAELLGEQEGLYPLPQAIEGKLTIERLTKRLEGFYEENPCYINRYSGVVCRADPDLELSPQFGNVYVKPLPEQKLISALWPQKGYLQTAGIYPREEGLIRLLAAAGVTRICAVEEMSELCLPDSHDGRLPLLEYSRLVFCHSLPPKAFPLGSDDLFHPEI